MENNVTTACGSSFLFSKLRDSESLPPVLLIRRKLAQQVPRALLFLASISPERRWKIAHKDFSWVLGFEFCR
jgi:hypothetical protein